MCAERLRSGVGEPETEPHQFVFLELVLCVVDRITERLEFAIAISIGDLIFEKEFLPGLLPRLEASPEQRLHLCNAHPKLDAAPGLEALDRQILERERFRPRIADFGFGILVLDRSIVGEKNKLLRAVG